MVAASLAAALDVPPLLAHLLLLRGCDTPEAARIFLESPLSVLEDPWQMAGMAVAVERLRAAVVEREPILVCGDYDVDGVSGTALLVSGLMRAGAEVSFAVPRRLEHGYGLPTSIVEQAIADGVRLILTVDNGISAHEAVALAQCHHLDILICDHHLPGETLPPATAILNPRQPGCPYPFKELCGVGIAFKLLQAFFGPGAGEELWPFLDLVALGTIADLVPLVGENRIFVAHGIGRLAASPRPGLQALLQVAGLSPSRTGSLSAGQVAFGLAPRLNAAGRMDDAAVAVRLLLTHDAEEARLLAQTLDRQNRGRQEVEESILKAALAQVEPTFDPERDRAIVLASPEWHPGVIGIVAAKLVERYGRPTALIAVQGDEARGSARTAAGWHIADALARCKDLLGHYGGHRAAGGFSLRTDRIEAFRQRFLELAAAELRDDDLLPTLTADAEVSLEGVDLELADALARLGPFGVANPEPTLVTRSLQTMRYPRVVGRNHLKMKVRQSGPGGPVLEAIGFNLGGLVESLSTPTVPWVDLAFTPERNVWNGRETLQLRVKDLRLLDSATAPALPGESLLP